MVLFWGFCCFVCLFKNMGSQSMSIYLFLKSVCVILEQVRNFGNCKLRKRFHIRKINVLNSLVSLNPSMDSKIYTSIQCPLQSLIFTENSVFKFCTVRKTQAVPFQSVLAGLGLIFIYLGLVPSWFTTVISFLWLPSL